MNKKFIKMNESNDYLSLGKVMSIIKDNAINKECAMQSEIFCTLFNIVEINNTTVNNYCIGYRAIGTEYKKIYFDLQRDYLDNKDCFIGVVIKIVSILEDKVYISNDNCLNIIQNSLLLKNVNNELIELMNNDKNISEHFKNDIIKNKDDNYNTFIKLISYAVLDNKQPVFIKNDLVIDKEDLDEYLKLNMTEGTNHILGLCELANQNNVYACAELGSLEFSGFVSGKKDIQKSYDYYLKSAQKNHPKGCWMVANLILTGRIGNLNKDFNLAWDYLNKAIELNSTAALNTMGNCYLKGLTPDKRIDEKRALEYYERAAEEGYVFAYNNIGLYYERHNNEKEALKYFDLSASLGESWALNKIGEYYRLKKDYKNAYYYYYESSNAPISNRNNYSLYNLAKYYYLNGNKELSIKKDREKAKEYLQIAAANGIKEALDLLEKERL